MDPPKVGGTNICQTCTPTCTQTWKAACSKARCSHFVHPYRRWGTRAIVQDCMGPQEEVLHYAFSEEGAGGKLMNGCSPLRISHYVTAKSIIQFSHTDSIVCVWLCFVGHNS